MKRLITLAFLCMAAISNSQASPAPDVSVNVDMFYSSLSPYGQWVNSDFGRAWRPLHVARGWRPYLYGRWAWTDYGWYWASSEPFGWATFHYGRWVYDDYYGWIWIPDDVWGPSWVEWRYNDDYVGWAPLPPSAGFNLSVGIVFSGRWAAPMHYWNFVPCRYFTAGRVVDYVQPLERTRRLFGTTREGGMIRSENHRAYNSGIDVGFIERRTNTHIERFDVVTSDRGRGDQFIRNEGRNQIEAYRPRTEGPNRGESPRTPSGALNPRPGGSGRDNASSAQSGMERAPAPRHQAQWQRQQDRMDRMRQQQMRENRSVPPSRSPQPPGRQRTQPRERPQSDRRQPESRGGRDGRRGG